MRTIVVGAGEVGYHVAERLANEKHDVVVMIKFLSLNPLKVGPQLGKFVQTLFEFHVEIPFDREVIYSTPMSYNICHA